MKNKILTFIIGVLVGAIITTIGFYIFHKTNINQEPAIPNGEMPQMMEQENGSTPPEKLSGEKGNNQGASLEMSSNVIQPPNNSNN